MRLITFSLFFIGVVAISLAAGAVPPGVPYGGYLEGPDGEPYTGSLDLEATLYDAPSGGQALWGPTVLSSVSATAGHFSVVIDDGTAPVAAALGGLDTAYFAFRVKPASTDWITLEGRQRLGAVAYAHEAMNAILLDGLSAAQYVTVEQLASSQSPQDEQLSSHSSTLAGHGTRLTAAETKTTDLSARVATLEAAVAALSEPLVVTQTFVVFAQDSGTEAVSVSVPASAWKFCTLTGFHANYFQSGTYKSCYMHFRSATSEWVLYASGHSANGELIQCEMTCYRR